METEAGTPPTPTAEPPARCEICGVTMRDHDELEQHLEGHAEKVAEGFPAVAEGPRHKCAFCGAAFDSAEELKEHNATAHQR